LVQTQQTGMRMKKKKRVGDSARGVTKRKKRTDWFNKSETNAIQKKIREKIRGTSRRSWQSER